MTALTMANMVSLGTGGTAGTSAPASGGGGASGGASVAVTMPPRSNIFGIHAPLYWGAGLQAIPLYENRKRPIIYTWQKYAKEPVSVDDMTQWLANYPYCNIGLALGQQSGITMIDIDIDDAAVMSLIRSLLPPTPWVRVGRKGVVLAYKWSGLKTFRIKTNTGEMLVECLSDRTQVVLPPSIHPDTGKPYTAGSDLYDPAVLSKLMALPPDLEAILRSALQLAGGKKLSLAGHTKVVEWVASGSRDTKMIQVAGFYAREALRGDRTFAEAIGDLYAWEQTQVEQVSGDALDVAKGVAQMAKFFINDVMVKKKSLPKGWDQGLSDAEKVDLGFDVFTDDNKTWDFDSIKDFIKGEYMIHDAHSNGRRKAVQLAIERLASTRLDVENPIEYVRLTDYIADAGQMRDKGSTIRKAVGRLKAQGLTGEDQTQIAKALLAEVNKEGELRFKANMFWQWRGSHWESFADFTLRREVADRYGHLPSAKKNGDHGGVVAIMSHQVAADLATTSVVGVNFANGYLTENLELLQHDPAYGCTYTLPFRYMDPPEELIPEVGAPMFAKFLKSCWGLDDDFEDKVQGLREAIAVTLFAHSAHFERAFLMFGPPKSGKSQMLKIIEYLLPDEGRCAVKPENWGDKFLPAQFFGKLLNVCGELAETKNIEGTLFKSIISGETIQAQHKNQHPFKFQPRCAHWFASNHLPRTKDTSEGFNRRWLVFQFKKPVSDKEKELDLGTIIAAQEREAIASWAVQAFPALSARREYTRSKSHTEVMDDVAKQNNSVFHFLVDGRTVIAQNLLVHGNSPIPELDLYNAYFTFAISAGVAKVVSQTSFRQKMEELGFLMGFRLIRTKNASGATDVSYTKHTPARPN